MSDIHYLNEMLKANHFDLNEEIQKKILHYLYMMQRWNRVTNLTSITDIHKMITLHILDSLVVHRLLHGVSILDIGSGAGLPGIPLALIDEKRIFTLLDSNQKKIRFLTQVKIELKLNHIEVVKERVQQFHPEQTFDSILTRGFASLKEMLTASAHLLNETGQFLAMKGVYPKNEIEEIPPPFRVIEVHPLIIKGLDAERHLVRLEKERSWQK